MKEFEKWFEKNKPYETYSCMDMAEKAWRTALKWVLSWETDSESIEIIEKELGNKAI